MGELEDQCTEKGKHRLNESKKENTNTITSNTLNSVNDKAQGVE